MPETLPAKSQLNYLMGHNLARLRLSSKRSKWIRELEARTTNKGAGMMLNSTIGVDVSKDWLEANHLPDGTGQRFANSATCRAP